MFSKGNKKGTVRFAFKPSETKVKRVQVAGDFNDWQPRSMRRQKDGAFVAVVPAGPGAHEYKFLVDDQWRTDPDNNAFSANPFGTVNSVAVVEA